MHESSRPYSIATGWLLSCLLHGSLAIATILFLQRIHLAPQGEPFQWNVAMVATSSPPVQSDSPGEPTPSPTRAQRSSPPAKNAHPAAQQIQPTKISPAASSPPVPPAPPEQEQPLLNESSASDPISSSQQTELTGPTNSPPVTDSALDPVPSLSASPASASPQTLAKVDYGWLAALMAQWIEGLDKRYPAALRTEGVEGKVTLAAMLHEDGLLSDVRIVRSSGNAALDQVALEDVRNGPPVVLSRPLERPRMAVKFSISYDLRMAQ